MPFAPQFATFFQVPIAIAGIFGAATASRRIFYMQAVPALLALALLWLICADATACRFDFSRQELDWAGRR